MCCLMGDYEEHSYSKIVQTSYFHASCLKKMQVTQFHLGFTLNMKVENLQVGNVQWTVV